MRGCTNYENNRSIYTNKLLQLLRGDTWISGHRFLLQVICTMTSIYGDTAIKNRENAILLIAEGSFLGVQDLCSHKYLCFHTT